MKSNRDEQFVFGRTNRIYILFGLTNVALSQVPWDIFTFCSNYNHPVDGVQRLWQLKLHMHLLKGAGRARFLKLAKIKMKMKEVHCHTSAAILKHIMAIYTSEECPHPSLKNGTCGRFLGAIFYGLPAKLISFSASTMAQCSLIFQC